MHGLSQYPTPGAKAGSMTNVACRLGTLFLALAVITACTAVPASAISVINSYKKVISIRFATNREKRGAATPVLLDRQIYITKNMLAAGKRRAFCVGGAPLCPNHLVRE
jgi:hypothetical protein